MHENTLFSVPNALKILTYKSSACPVAGFIQRHMRANPQKQMKAQLAIQFVDVADIQMTSPL